MFKPDPRPLASISSAPITAAGFDDAEHWEEVGGESDTLLQLFGAAVLAIVALAVASFVLI